MYILLILIRRIKAPLQIFSQFTIISVYTLYFWGLTMYFKVGQRSYREPILVAVTGPARRWLTIGGCVETYLAYMICRAESTWERACCLAKFPSRLRRILASDGRLGFVLLCPHILLFTVDESLSDWTPVAYSSTTDTVTDAKWTPAMTGQLHNCSVITRIVYAVTSIFSNEQLHLVDKLWTPSVIKGPIP